MANEEQLSILKRGVEVWNRWRMENAEVSVDLDGADLRESRLIGANLSRSDLGGALLMGADLTVADLTEANLYGAVLSEASLNGADLILTNLNEAALIQASLFRASLSGAILARANLRSADLRESLLDGTDLREANLSGSNLGKAEIGGAFFGNSDLSDVLGLDETVHSAPSSISTDAFARSKGRVSEIFLKGCGLSDWEVEEVKLYIPDLSNDDVTKILNRIYELRATRALQISPLFISYSHGDGKFVDSIGSQLSKRGIRYWRDIHDMRAGRIETQIEHAIRQNPTVLLVLSAHSLESDWVEHEVRTARELEKESGRDVLCPIALDDSWKDSRWPRRIMEQIMEYNILDFTGWQDDAKFDEMFHKLIDGLELFYKG